MRNKGENRRGVNKAVGTRGQFFGQETATKDMRGTVPAKSLQGLTICPICQASVGIKKATGDECGQYGAVSGIKLGNLIIRKHRVGGGQYSIMRGDVLCNGFGLPIPKEDL